MNSSQDLNKLREESIFTPFQKDKELFLQSLSFALLSDKPVEIINLGKTPPLLNKLGFTDREVLTRKSVIKKAVSADPEHNISAGTIGNIQSLIYDPLAVVKSKTQKNSFVLILNDHDLSTRQVVAIIRPEVIDGIKCNFIPSVYGRNEFKNFMDSNLRQENIMYVQKNSPEMLGQLQLPYETFQDYAKSILTKEDIVKFHKLDKKTDNGLCY